jgi:RNA polymerase sigma factor (sigma-70 family)
MVQEAMKSGSKSADGDFEDLFITQFPRVRGTVARIVGYGPAEDVALEAFARAYARWDQVGSIERPVQWVYRVATNLALDQTRRKTRLTPGRDKADSQDEVATRDSLVESLRQLPRRQQEVVVLRYIVDMSEAEVSRALNMSLGTVKTHLRRALPRLRSSLLTSEEVLAP